MQKRGWHSSVVALSPQLRQAVAEIIARPAASTSPTAPGGRRALSTSCSRLAMAQRSAVRPKQAAARSQKPAPKPSKPSKQSKPPKLSKLSPKAASSKPSSRNAAKLAKTAPKAASPVAQAKARPSKARAPLPLAPSDHIRALSFLPPLHTPKTPTSPPPPSAAAIETTTADDEVEAAAKAAVAEAVAEAAAAAAASVRLGPTPTTAALDRASSLFMRPEPQFLYSAPRFLNLPVNTRMPEICILGRSNVGKSTLLNALAGLESGGKAGHSHGARPGRFGLAITSARAGCTKMMNGYGFGPPLRASQQQVFERVLEKEEADADKKTKRAEASPVSTSNLSRSQKRALAPGEPSPAHSLVIIDMPGYGFMSKSEWGTEITKYLERRATLRGAILLVDAVAGLKDGDRHALAMLRDANIRTVVILTKADKLLPPRLLRMPAAVAAAKQEERALTSSSSFYSSSSASSASLLASPEPAFKSGASEGEQALRTSCLRVWKTLRRIERASFGTVPWMEGQGWSPEIVVTGAGDPRGGGFGVAGARLAICRVAGLIPQHGVVERTTSLASTKKQKKAAIARGETVGDGCLGASAAAPSSTVVPFDQIQWSETATEATIDQSAELRYIEQQEEARQQRKLRSQHRIPTQTANRGGQPAAEVEEAPSPLKASAAGPRAASAGGRRRPWKR
ncbi:hypothetical protein SCUCBS95973_000555 [Sporothrix curviconia]|uniref:EngB-type G domain-containing protein n=1 Tax=Sporothrix curviconia TaxID=1260050 RepID=A0ABP0ARB1_9PEZI